MKCSKGKQGGFTQRIPGLSLILITALGSISSAHAGSRLIIVAPDSFAAAARPLAEWRSACGILTDIVRLSEIGRDTAAIRDYLLHLHASPETRPEFVLLFGAPESIPAGRFTGRLGDRCGTDNLYGDMTGDYRAELAVGRLPCRSFAQAELLVAKTLAYERAAFVRDSFWMRRLTTVIRNDFDPDDTLYWTDCRIAAGLASSAGFVGCDSLATELGHNRTHVVSSVNGGTGLILYRGQATGNWYTPFDVNPRQTTNRNMLPIVVSATCYTVTLFARESMVGDAWMKTGNLDSLRGAVAFFGNTHGDHDCAVYRSAVSRGFFSGMFSDKRRLLGRVAQRAREQLLLQYPGEDKDYLGFNLLGDPTLPVWTGEPLLPQVDHPAAIDTGPQLLAATVLRGGLPAESALVCASMDSAVYAWAYTGVAGTVQLLVNPRDTGRLRFVVTGRNQLPYDTFITVAPLTGAAEEPASARPTPPRLVASPTVTAGSTELLWGAAAPPGWSLAVCDLTGRVVRRWSGLSGTGVSWDGPGTSDLCPPDGVYIGLLRDGAGDIIATTRFVLLQ